MNKADKYLKEIILEIMEEGCVDQNPRAKWSDGTPAYSKFTTQKVFQYDISKKEFPITTLRTTALKGAFHDIEAIYLKQTNILEEFDKSIWFWWKDFVVDNGTTLGTTYGDTVKRYDLMNSLLEGLEKNPFGRRHIIDMWQERQLFATPEALPPCAYSTLWSVREKEVLKDYHYSNKANGSPIYENVRYIDITLIQRSMDFCMTSSINPAQYTMLAMMVCNHLTFKTGVKHEVGKLLHLVQNCHIYLRHFEGASEILERESTGKQPKIELICEPKDFYSHNINDFKFSELEGIKKLSTTLEIAI